VAVHVGTDVESVSERVETAELDAEPSPPTWSSGSTPWRDRRESDDS
jgi:hypothetical protein